MADFADRGRRLPNVLLVMVDQLRADILSTYGGQLCQTPGLAAFAARSRVFDRAYTPLAVCSPARASVLTGRYPHNHGVISNQSQLTNGVLRDSPQLLSRRLEAMGYDRWYGGKWHLGGADNLPIDCGLPGLQLPGHGEGGYDYPEYRSYLADRELHVAMNDGPHQLGWHSYGTLDGSGGTDVSTFVTDSALTHLDDWSRREQTKPFFTWVNYWGPHEPYNPTDEFLALYEDTEIPPWPNFPDNTGPLRPRVHSLKIPPESAGAGWDFWVEAVRHYFAFMTLIDRQIARLLDWLDRSGHMSNTIVIFTADHGESLGAHSCQDKGHFMYEEIYRVPLMIHAPGLAPGRDDHLVSLIDLYPTVMELAEGEPTSSQGIDGRSLVDLLRGGSMQNPSVEWRESLAAEFHGLITPYTQRMIVDKRFKYVWNMGDVDELYDLEQDPYELANLIETPSAASHRDRLQDSLAEWMRQSGDATCGYFDRYVRHIRATRSEPARPVDEADGSRSDQREVVL